MKAILRLNDYPNLWGSLASGLCLAHCLATPFLFAAHTGHVQVHHSHPVWWGFLDLLFIAISFVAVLWSVKNTSKEWIKFALWISWALLAMVIVNEKLELLPLAEVLIYIPSIALIVLHLYNRRYCKCNEKSCCAVSHTKFKNDGETDESEQGSL